MAYIIDPAAQKAISQLKMWDYNNHSRSNTAGDLGAALGGSLHAAAVRKPKTTPQPVSTHGPEMYGKYVQGTGAVRGMQQAGYEQMANQELLDQADQNVKLNNLAEQSRVGGAFTPDGLETASKQADANAADRLRLRSMLGIAATPVMSGSVPAMAPGMGAGSF